VTEVENTRNIYAKEPLLCGLHYSSPFRGALPFALPFFFDERRGLRAVLPLFRGMSQPPYTKPSGENPIGSTTRNVRVGAS